MRLILLTLLAACGTPQGVCIYGPDDPDLENSCWPESIMANCATTGDRFVKAGSCVDEGFTVDCNDLGVFFTRTEAECEAAP